MKYIYQLGIPWDKAVWDTVYKFNAVAADEEELKAMIEPFRAYIDKQYLPHQTACELAWEELNVTKLGVALNELESGWIDYSTKLG